MLRRVIQTAEGHMIVQRSTEATQSMYLRYYYSLNHWNVTESIFYRDKSDEVSRYEPIALIDHQGSMLDEGETQGHYICDIKDKKSQLWFRTNDNEEPFKISLSES